MTALPSARPPRAALVAAALDRACDAVAPTWPLDQFIAVNPLWGWVDRPVEEAAARAASLAAVRLTMPPAWYREQLRSGGFAVRHVRAALAERGEDRTAEAVLAEADAAASAAPARALVADLVEAAPGQPHPWRDYVRHSLSQFCAAWFDEGQASLRPPAAGGLFAAWRRAAELDAGPRLAMGFLDFAAQVQPLPTDARALVEAAVDALYVPTEQVEAYLTALVLDLNGWAAWCAGRRWTARLAGGDDDTLVDLVAMRIAWEWVLFAAGGARLAERWFAAQRAWPACDARAAAGQAGAWTLQRALELATHERLVQALAAGVPGGSTAPDAEAAPSFQAVFCIDVRSEPMRRAVEAGDPRARTLGFAGFFGVPMAYRPVGAPAARPHLPGLLAPRLLATDGPGAAGLAGRRQARAEAAVTWKRFARSALSGFTFVEATGIPAGVKLLADALGWTRPAPHPEQAGLAAGEAEARRPRLAGTVGGVELGREARVDLAAGILRGVSLTHGFARLVLLVGHGSRTVNNAHAAGLDCGACCGQTGEVSARVAAALLNDPDVRAGLAERGLRVPDTTWFVPALHDTTTDDVALFELSEVPASHAADVAAVQAVLARAGERARRERAPRLGLGALDGAALRAAVAARARDWAQVRPEWGLAGNAAFVVARRERTRGLDLGGRAFLHEYRWEEDAGFAVLEQVMTAPMVVTHWINFQYYASTVDNRKFGSGDKVLHNVVGGRIGVFEGNGGDLRIGLPLQSLHDGAGFVHVPVRLAVFIEAPSAAVAGVVQRHARVRELVENEWLFLYRFGAGEPGVQRWARGRWVDGEPAAREA